MSKISGFKLSGNKRKKIIESTQDVDAKEVITSIEGNVVNSLVNKEVKQDLVIPLPPPLNPNGVYVPTKHSKETVNNILNNDSLEAGVITAGTQSIEELAAEEILKDLSGKSKSTAAPLVIKSVNDVGDKVDSSSGDGKETESELKKAPLLMANIAPELFGINNDDERFKVDVDLRADNMDVTSDAYVTVPIADFGAAMLRGMGWKGLTAEDEEKGKYSVVPRDYRLGLGATPKPPDESTRGKSKKEKEKEKNKWQLKAEAQLSKQNLQVGCLVWLRLPALVGKRAEVTATAGVPGLNKIRVCLELTGELVEVSKMDAVLLTEEELKAEPFSRQQQHRSSEGESERVKSGTKRKGKEKESDKERDAARREDKRDDRRDSKRSKHDSRDDYHRDRDRDQYSRDRDRERDKETVKDRFRDRDRDRDREREAAAPVPSGGWVRTGIRVKVISKKVDHGKCYLKKGSVVEVYFPSSNSSTKMASVRMDGEGGKGRVQEVKESHLETVLPAERGTCLLLSGEHAGSAAVLLEKNHHRNTVSVQLVEDMDIVTIGMDAVAALA